MRAAVGLGVATAAFGVVHSLLASEQAKSIAARLVGTRRRDAGYRTFFSAQALATFGLLVYAGSRVPKRTLYQVRGPLAALMRAGQLAGVAWGTWAAREVGVARLAGLPNVEAYRRGEPIPEGPAAQGPERDASGALTTGGPFRWSRHPLNLAPLPAFWLTPHLTTRRLAFNVVSTAYLVLGSAHEERRLKALYGDDYEAYRRSGVPFYLPSFLPNRLPPTQTGQVSGLPDTRPVRPPATGDQPLIADSPAAASLTTG